LGEDNLLVEPLSLVHLDKWKALFDRASVTCFCRFWHFEGDKNAWLARNAFEPEENAREAAEAVRTGDGTARGLIAIEGDRVVGWMKLAPRAFLPKLRRMPVYRILDAETDHAGDGSTYSIGCFLVDPERRRSGVAQALVAAAPDYARSLGATRLEAYPRRSETPLYDEEALMGPERLYIEAGFAPLVHPGSIAETYPVYILTL
jgi:GNAT superfamily N-acetyltransferase